MAFCKLPNFSEPQLLHRSKEHNICLSSCLGDSIRSFIQSTSPSSWTFIHVVSRLTNIKSSLFLAETWAVSSICPSDEESSKQGMTHACPFFAFVLTSQALTCVRDYCPFKLPFGRLFWEPGSCKFLQSPRHSFECSSVEEHSFSEGGSGVWYKSSGPTTADFGCGFELGKANKGK